VELIEAKEVLPRLTTDLEENKDVCLWCYTVEPQFFDSYFLAKRPAAKTLVLMDYRQRDRLRHFLKIHPRLELRHWQRNRTQHDKTIICVNTGVVWFTTSNLHRGSFMLANNRALRVTAPTVVTKILTTFLEQWQLSQLIEEETHS
jgi:hypothetical protein